MGDNDLVRVFSDGPKQTLILRSPNLITRKGSVGILAPHDKSKAFTKYPTLP